MSTDLEALIRETAKSGNLHGITLFASGQHGWQGNVRYNSDGWRVEVSHDPVEALVAALKSTVRYDHTNPVPHIPPEENTTAGNVILKGGLFD